MRIWQYGESLPDTLFLSGTTPFGEKKSIMEVQMRGCAFCEVQMGNPEAYKQSMKGEDDEREDIFIHFTLDNRVDDDIRL